MRKSNQEKNKDKARELLEEYLEIASKKEAIELVGFLQGILAMKKLGIKPSLEDTLWNAQGLFYGYLYQERSMLLKIRFQSHRLY